MLVSLTVNGNRVELDVPPGKRLLDIVRNDLDLHGTKEGCSHGECGSCLVYLNGSLVNSCLVPAFQLNEAEVMTIEGCSQTKEFGAIERAFAETLSIRCGFCGPGVAMATWALLTENPSPTEEDIRAGLLGNLCRCTGYRSLVEGVERASTLWSRKRRVRRG